MRKIILLMAMLVVLGITGCTQYHIDVQLYPPVQTNTTPTMHNYDCNGQDGAGGAYVVISW